MKFEINGVDFAPMILTEGTGMEAILSGIDYGGEPMFSATLTIKFTQMTVYKLTWLMKQLGVKVE